MDGAGSFEGQLEPGRNRGLVQWGRKVLRFEGRTYGNVRYREGPVLGSGNYGVTRVLLDVERGHEFAGKFIPRQEITEDVEREILNHRPLDHPNVIRFVEVYTTAADLVVVMELASEGELFNVLERGGALPEPEARSFFRQIISGLAYCHDQHVVHRDLKLENLLVHRPAGPLGDAVVKLCDFGFSKHMVNHSTAHTCKGSPDYIAPEVINAGWRRSGGARYDGRKADVWSCGVILYLLVTGQYPFEATNGSTIPNNIVNGWYSFPETPRLSREVRDLISSILDPNPGVRPTVAELERHPWLAQHPQVAESHSSDASMLEQQSEAEVYRVLAEAREPRQRGPLNIPSQ
mmetsp:Transcript_16230/g.48622  ORF Transcript_16230/g.48622 Transcript_16230/m.48622 type:complete len:348 (-) Transcript_16230:1469-2512(-)|eukprot:CAMPEP_0206136052 /NCGR_PEP_ID=MMETSP1473-20131121/1286_1 /ASSEMBLY_ACC=CAM_ASM_001109 /TAXON_ID=1461547 /ORGANISM="Stichococcus sp, Strain RCC1054" /LENGTH=347 /DNA_ID=CAMNT_0053528289 /DNA_START=61 /DNA_END=1104 /DNA_ORIENTATION=+